MKTKLGIPSVSEFAENIRGFLAQMRERDEPMVLSVDGEPALYVMDLRLAEHLSKVGQREFQELLSARVGAIDRGEDDSMPLEEAFKEIREQLAKKKRP